MPSIVDKFGPPPRMWLSYKIGLDALNDRLNRTSDGSPIHSAIDDNLASPDDLQWSWNRLFAAERMLVPLMSEDLMSADIIRRLARAKDWGVREAEEYGPAYDSAETPEAKRAVYEQLIDCLHYSYFRRVAEGEVRRSTAFSLNWVGILLLGTTIAVLVYVTIKDLQDEYVHHHILVVMWFGLLGSYLSRMIAFQSAYETLPYEKMRIDFSVWSLIVRLIVGALAALIFYLLIVGELVGGEFFPQIHDAMFFEERVVGKQQTKAVSVEAEGIFGNDGAFEGTVSIETRETVEDPRSAGPEDDPEVSGPIMPENTDLMDLAPVAEQVDKPTSNSANRRTREVRSIILSSDFAKLLIWATLAGFSERLLPDRLTSISRGRKSENGSQPGPGGDAA